MSKTQKYGNFKVMNLCSESSILANTMLAHTDVCAFHTITYKITVFYDVTSCSLVDQYSYSGETCCLHLQVRREKQQVPLEHWYLSTRLQCVTFQKTIS